MTSYLNQMEWPIQDGHLSRRCDIRELYLLMQRPERCVIQKAQRSVWYMKSIQNRHGKLIEMFIWAIRCHLGTVCKKWGNTADIIIVVVSSHHFFMACSWVLHLIISSEIQTVAWLIVGVSISSSSSETQTVAWLIVGVSISSSSSETQTVAWLIVGVSISSSLLRLRLLHGS